MTTHFVIELCLAFIVVFSMTALINPFAQSIALVDRPDKLRKNHSGTVPLTGGIAIYLGLLTVSLTSGLAATNTHFLLASGLMVLAGALDDRFDLNISLRILLEIMAASIMVFGADLWVGNLGNLLGLGEIHMPFWFAYPFTVIAVFGIVNAINMIDGMDGLAGSVSFITLAVLLMTAENSPTLTDLGAYLIGGLVAFLLFNFRFPGQLPKVFLGDSGSKLLGLTLVWIVIEAAQTNAASVHGINPATALFILGLPLIDMVATTVRRLKKGAHPFRADRTHVHHILLRAGFGKTTALCLILILALSINLLGVALQLLNANEALQFTIFFLIYFMYYSTIQHAWKLSKWLRQSNNPDPNKQASFELESGKK